jgi:hypothetical protein
MIFIQMSKSDPKSKVRKPGIYTIFAVENIRFFRQQTATHLANMHKNLIPYQLTVNG